MKHLYSTRSQSLEYSVTTKQITTIQAANEQKEIPSTLKLRNNVDKGIKTTFIGMAKKKS